MDSQNLTAFLEVARSGSFSIAAERLHLTQPAVSKRIATLEDQLNIRLFDRIGRTISLTEAGRVLLPRANQIVQTLKDTRQQLADLSGEVGGKLDIAISHHVGLHRLPPVLRDFTRACPKVELNLRFLGSENAYAQVAQGQIELAVITLSPEAQPGIHAISLWHDPLEFVVSPQHPLAGKSQLTLADLSSFPAILPELNTYTTQIVKQLFDQADQPLQLSMATNFLETIRMMVSIDLGWSVLPATLLDDGLQVLTMNGVQLSRELGVIYHHNRSLTNAAQAFMRTLNVTSAT